jgi:PAS domain S-box-containing protein
MRVLHLSTRSWGLFLFTLLLLGLVTAKLKGFVLLVDLVAIALLCYLYFRLDRELSQRNCVLRESNARLDLANDMILVRDLSDLITYWNPACEKTYGWTEKEALGQHIHQLLKTEFPEPLTEIQAQFLQQGQWRGELVQTTKTGRKLTVSSTWSLHRDEQGKYLANLEIDKDITETKQAAEALRSRAEVLAKTTAILEKRNQELDRFAYIVSHDLKAPLRAIANLSSWIEEDLDGKLEGETQHHMNLLRSRVKRMEALIDGLLQYSRVGRLQSPLEMVNTRELIEEIIDSLDPPPEIKIKIKGEMPVFKTERLLLNQVLSNLISNSIKHRETPQGKVEIDVKDAGNFYEFAIADDGTGIDPQYHDRIFVMFQTLQPRDKVENTGVGLAIVRKIIEEKEGKISVESEEGQGSTFRFTWSK